MKLNPYPTSTASSAWATSTSRVNRRTPTGRRAWRSEGGRARDMAIHPALSGELIDIQPFGIAILSA